MKLDSDTLSFIQTVVHTAGLVDIESIIIDEESVRGLADNNTVVLLEKDIPSLSVGAIGINRTDVFQQRLDVVSELEKFAVDAVVDGEFVRSLTMKAKGTKVDYRCANPTTIRAPRVINDQMSATVQLNPDAVKMLQKGVAAMGAEVVELRSDKNGISFALIDTNQDTFEYSFAGAEGNVGEFAHKYPTKTLLALFKHDPENTFEVGAKGTLLVKINGLGVYVLPKV